MKFKVDEDLPADVAELLRTAGHDASTVREEALTGTPDELLWSHVKKEMRCLLTADKGFANALVHPPGTHSGVVLFRLHRESRQGYLRLVQSFLGAFPLDSPITGIVVIGTDAIRVHKS